MGMIDDDFGYSTWVEEEEDLYRFQGDKNLRLIDSCGSITRIPNRAFYGCSHLEWIEIPNTLLEIESDAFCFCDSLTSIYLDSVRIIGDGAFSYCENLKEVDFGYDAQLEKLGDEVFKKCIGLNSITLPASIKQIGGNVFEGCGEKNRHFQLNYKGAKSNFRKIKLDRNWNSGSTIEKISCSDGDLYIRIPEKEYL